MFVEIFEVVVDGCGCFRSSHVSVLTMRRTPMWVMFFDMVFVGD